MSGNRLPNAVAPDSAASSSMNQAFFNSNAQSLYTEVYREMRKILDSYAGMNRVQGQLSNIGPPASTTLSDYSNAMLKQNNVNSQPSHYTFPKANGITHNFVNQISPTGDGNQMSLDSDPTIASTIQFDLGTNPMNCPPQQNMGSNLMINCSSQQSSLIDYSTPYTYSQNAPGIGVALPNQTCFSHDSSLASTLWNMTNGFPCGSSGPNNLSPANMGNDSTVDYTARWDVDGSLDSSAGASQASLSNNNNNLQITPSNVQDEVRLRPFIAEIPKSVEHRIERALDHRLYTIDQKLVGDPQSPTGCDYQVLGVSGNIYTVRLANIPSCTCRDPQHTCIHILFIMLRVLKLSGHDPRIWQTALLSSEVRDLLQNTGVTDTNVGIANPRVRQWLQDMSSTSQVGEAGNGEGAGVTLQNLQRDASGDCPVCFESLSNQNAMSKEELSFCKVCGNNVHKDCFMRWSLSRQEAGERVTCIFCRSLWLEDNSTLKKRKPDSDIGSDGYGNLVDYSGGDSHTEDLTIDRLYSQPRPKYMREWRPY